MKPYHHRTGLTPSLELLALGLLAVTAALPLLAQTAPAPSAKEPEVGDTVVLSPFEVNSSNDKGYQAQNTLSGTRLNSAVADLGTTLTILTPDVWNDLGLYDTNSLITYTPGAEKRDTNEFEGNGGNLFWGDQTRFRGIPVENIVRNYFRTEIPSDTYNADRFEFTRGPNAVLFGVAGDASGLVNRSTQDAQFRNTYLYSLQVDNYGSVRQTINANRELKKDTLGIRLALLDSRRNGWLVPFDFQDQKRVYLAGQYRPFRNLTLKANYERYDWTRAAVSNVIVFDSVTPWINAGKPSRPSLPGPAPAAIPGIRNYAGNAPRLMAVYDGRSAQPYFQDWNNRALGANNSILGSTSLSLPPKYLDRRFDLVGEAAIQRLGGQNTNLLVDYQLHRDLVVQYAYNDEWDRYDFFSGAGSRLNVDASSTLSDGSPNPNFGRYFTLSEPTFRLKQDRYRRDHRFTGSYHFEFAKVSERLKWLGVHDLAAMYELDTQEHYWDVLVLINTTPLPGSPTSLGDNANVVRFVHYLDVDSNTINGVMSSLDWQREGSKLPGVRAEWLPRGGPTAFKTQLSSQLYVLQSRFWDNRLVTTFGWRRDGIEQRSLLTSTLTPLAPGLQNYARAGSLVRDEKTSSLAPQNRSLGAVFHVLRNKGVLDDFSLTYNQSTSFTVTNFTLMPNRQASPSQTGRTKDIGARFEMFNHRIGTTFTVFDAAVNNINDVRGNGYFDRMSDLFNLIGKTEYYQVPQVREIQDKTSRGYEIQVTGNLTPNWRVMGSISYYRTINTNIAQLSGQLIEQYKSQWLANPSALVPNRGSETAQQVYNDLVFNYAVEQAGDGTRALNERRNKYVGLTNYTFSEGLLKGVSVGGDVVWQDKPAVGYALKQLAGSTTFVPDAQNPFFGSSLMTVGLQAGYTRKIWNDRLTWTVRLNLRNILGTEPYVTRAGAASTAPTTKVVRVYARGEPTVFSLTNTLRF